MSTETSGGDWTVKSISAERPASDGDAAAENAEASDALLNMGRGEVPRPSPRRKCFDVS